MEGRRVQACVSANEGTFCKVFLNSIAVQRVNEGREKGGDTLTPRSIRKNGCRGDNGQKKEDGNRQCSQVRLRPRTRPDRREAATERCIRMCLSVVPSRTTKGEREKKLRTMCRSRRKKGEERCRGKCTFLIFGRAQLAGGCFQRGVRAA